MASEATLELRAKKVKLSHYWRWYRVPPSWKFRVMGESAAKRQKTRALARLFKVFRLTEKMTREEVITEAHLAYKLGKITKRQARALGCVIGGM